MTPSPLGPVPGLGYARSVTQRPLTRLSDEPPRSDAAGIAEEIPVAFVYNGESFVVVMASPADLEDLAIGFSITEGIVASRSEIDHMEAVRHSRGIELQMTIPASAA